MWIHVNKKTRRIEGYTEFSLEDPLPNKGCELIEIREIPENWQYCRYENHQIILDKEYQLEKENEEKLMVIRQQRETACFPIINRGKLWYDSLSNEQSIELQNWYQNWLDAPETMIIPTMPAWIK